MGRTSSSSKSRKRSSNQSQLNQLGNLDSGITINCVPHPGYKLEEYLGRGSYGEVWSALDPEGKKVALKFLRCDNGKGGRELRTLQKIRQLKHPHVIHHQGIWCYQSFLVVSMELADGGLDHLLNQAIERERKPLDKETVCHFLGQAAAALDFLNTRQHLIDGEMVAVYHCDVKPSNILILGDQAKLTDFGLSLITQTQIHGHSSLGTAGFAAPEVFQGRYNDRVDQYALAVSFCFLISGRAPFPDSPNRFTRGYVRPAPDLSIVPDSVRAVVARALNPIYLSRWSSCSDFIAELRKLAF